MNDAIKAGIAGGQHRAKTKLNELQMADSPNTGRDHAGGHRIPRERPKHCGRR